jgi:hypothetical protein
MASFSTDFTGFGTTLAMIMLVHPTFVGTHAANFFAQNQVLMPYF